MKEIVVLRGCPRKTMALGRTTAIPYHVYVQILIRIDGHYHIVGFITVKFKFYNYFPC